MSCIEFTKKEIEIIDQVCKLLDECLIDTRKGIAQSRYVIKIDEGEYTDWRTGDEHAIPENLIGTWMMAFPTDLQYETLKDCLKSQWVKCKKEEVKTYEWVQDND